MQLLHHIYNFTDSEVPGVYIEVQKQNTQLSLTLNEYCINIQLKLSYFQLCYGMTQLEQTGHVTAATDLGQKTQIHRCVRYRREP